MSKSSKSRRASPFQNRKVWLPLAVVVVVVGYYAFSWWQEGAARSERRTKLLADCVTELEKAEPDADQLSKLMAGLQRLSDSDTAPDVLAARAEIELVRGRAERADDLFGSIAASPSATGSQSRLGARILLGKQQVFGGDAGAASRMLEQAVSMSERAYEDNGDAMDLFRAWQASKRLFDHERAKQFAQQLASSHGTSAVAQLVELAPTFNPQRDRQKLLDLEGLFSVLPVELSAMRTMAVLAGGNIPGALRAAEADLNRAPGVPIVRYVTAIVLHASISAAGEGSAERAKLVQRRDKQLDWLDQRAPPAEKQRERWRLMRQAR